MTKPPYHEIYRGDFVDDEGNLGPLGQRLAAALPGGPGGDLSDYQAIAEKGQPDGYAALDGDGLVPEAQLPPGGSSGAVWVGPIAISFDTTDLYTTGAVLTTLTDDSIVSGVMVTVSEGFYDGSTDYGVDDTVLKSGGVDLLQATTIALSAVKTAPDAVAYVGANLVASGEDVVLLIPSGGGSTPPTTGQANVWVCVEPVIAP